LDKLGKEKNRLKMELMKVQEESAREHASIIRLERELKAQKKQCDDLANQKRHGENEIKQLESNCEESRKEIVELKKEVAQLSKKQDEETWITKSEYNKLDQKLKQAEKEIERMNRKN